MPKIRQMFAYIVADAGPEDEGVIGELVGDHWMPFVGADEERMRSLRPRAELVAAVLGKPVTLARFSVREDLEEIQPAEERR